MQRGGRGTTVDPYLSCLETPLLIHRAPQKIEMKLTNKINKTRHKFKAKRRVRQPLGSDSGSQRREAAGRNAEKTRVDGGAAEASVQHHKQRQLPGGGAPPRALTSEPSTASGDDAHRWMDGKEDLPATNDEKKQ